MKDLPVLQPHTTVRQVVATMAIEDMYLSQEFIEKLEQVAIGTISSEELRQEVIKKYVR